MNIRPTSVVSISCFIGITEMEVSNKLMLIVHTILVVGRCTSRSFLCNHLHKIEHDIRRPIVYSLCFEISLAVCRAFFMFLTKRLTAVVVSRDCFILVFQMLYRFMKPCCEIPSSSTKIVTLHTSSNIEIKSFRRHHFYFLFVISHRSRNKP